MRLSHLRSSIWLPRPLEVVFDFFADARNLEVLTPPWLRFQIVTPEPIAMRPGARIAYRLKLHGIPLRWDSEIAVWEPPYRFVDVQRRGPYRRWVHEHTFEEQGGGTLVSDHVRYAVLGGALVERLFVRPDVEKIFAYRREKLIETFGERVGASPAVAAAPQPGQLGAARTDRVRTGS